jgi:hypothetical protein
MVSPKRSAVARLRNPVPTYHMQSEDAVSGLWVPLDVLSLELKVYLSSKDMRRLEPGPFQDNCALFPRKLRPVHPQRVRNGQ